MIRGFGHIPDTLEDVETDNRIRHVGGLVGRNVMFAPSRDWTPELDEVLDQGSTNACVAHALSNVTYLAGKAQRNPIPRISRRWSYAVGRWVDSPNVLIDDGTRPRAMMIGSQEHGLVSERRLPWDPARVNASADFTIDLDQSGQEAYLTGYYRVSGDVATLCRTAIDKGHFPMLAMVVHASFQDVDASGDVYDEPRGGELGRHMVSLVGYRPGSILLLNSWGTGWGQNGLCWVGDRFVNSHWCSDVYVVTAAPRV